MKSEPVLKVEGLVKEFKIGRFPRVKTLRAVNKVDFEIGRSEVLGLVGESGSGKSTVARVIVRLYTPTAGRLSLDGKEIPRRMGRHTLRTYHKNVQMIFQDPFSSLNPVHTIRYILSRPLRIHGIAKGKALEATTKALLERCGLTPAERYWEKYPYELSGGERQRVGIARVLAVDPKLVLADEPTSMLDVSIRLDIMNLMLGLKDEHGLSYLFITHDLAGAHYMCDRIAIMYAGHLVEIGPSDTVINEPEHPYTQLLKQAAPKPEQGLAFERVETAGDMVDLTALPLGCPFEPRCPYARTQCGERLPEMIELNSDHLVRCVLKEGQLST